MRSIGVVTVARSDYGIYLPVLRQIEAQPDLRLGLFVTGMHLSPEFGLTVRQIEQDGFPITEKIEMLLSSDTPSGIARSMGLGITGFAQAYQRFRPDILLVLGDRFEMFAAVAAAVPFAFPIAHLHGGELTAGAIDDAFRHSITKMSHLHFVSTEEYARRVAQLGEEPWRITVTGAPALDVLPNFKPVPQVDLERAVGMSLDTAPLLVTFHPVTLEAGDTPRHVTELLAALEDLGLPVVFTYPNADTAGRVIIQRIEEFCHTHSRARTVANLGSHGYFSLMQQAAAMVGNSSSGIIEAASFELPVVNIGTRQQGRLQPQNVINSSYDRRSILDAVRRATNRAFKDSLRSLQNPYGEGKASEHIVKCLRTVDLNQRLLIKEFNDFEVQHDAIPTHQPVLSCAVATS